MKVITLPYGPFVENTYIIYDPATKECAIVDPGVSNPEEEEHLAAVIDQLGLRPVHLINTHMHLDHVMGNAWALKKYGTAPEANRADEQLGRNTARQAQMFGLPSSPKPVEVSTYLEDGDEIKIGDGKLKVLAVPGHSPGSIALYDAEDGFVITGDALFQGSIGRTDLPGGDFGTLIDAIRRKLLTLPPSTTVYPGHGPVTTIGAEERMNPYLR